MGEKNIVANETYKTKSGIVRKYKCEECGRVFNDRTGTAFEYIHLTREEHNLIMACQANGVGVRRATDIVGCTPKTVLKGPNAVEIMSQKYQNLWNPKA